MVDGINMPTSNDALLNALDVTKKNFRKLVGYAREQGLHISLEDSIEAVMAIGRIQKEIYNQSPKPVYSESELSIESRLPSENSNQDYIDAGC
jgi:hypothetical protein